MLSPNFLQDEISTGEHLFSFKKLLNANRLKKKKKKNSIDVYKQINKRHSVGDDYYKTKFAKSQFVIFIKSVLFSPLFRLCAFMLWLDVSVKKIAPGVMTGNVTLTPSPSSEFGANLWINIKKCPPLSTHWRSTGTCSTHSLRVTGCLWMPYRHTT